MLTTQKVFERYEKIRPRLPQANYPSTTRDITSILEISDQMDGRAELKQNYFHG